MEQSPQSNDLKQEQAPIETPLPTATPMRKRWLSKPLLIGAGLLAGICLCVALCMTVFGASLFGVASQKDDVAKVIDAWMQAMSKKNANQAYALFSKRAQRQVPLSKVEEMLNGANFALYEGYDKVEIGSLKIGPQFNTNPNVPQGTVANVAGTVIYRDGHKGQFQAILEQEDNAWKLDGLNVTVPLQKLEEYLKKNQ